MRNASLAFSVVDYHPLQAEHCVAHPTDYYIAAAIGWKALNVVDRSNCLIWYLIESKLDIGAVGPQPHFHANAEIANFVRVIPSSSNGD